MRIFDSQSLRRMGAAAFDLTRCPLGCVNLEFSSCSWENRTAGSGHLNSEEWHTAGRMSRLVVVAILHVLACVAAPPGLCPAWCRCFTSLFALLGTRMYLICLLSLEGPESPLRRYFVAPQCLSAESIGTPATMMQSCVIGLDSQTRVTSDGCTLRTHI